MPMSGKSFSVLCLGRANGKGAGAKFIIPHPCYIDQIDLIDARCLSPLCRLFSCSV